MTIAAHQAAVERLDDHIGVDAAQIQADRFVDLTVRLQRLTVRCQRVNELAAKALAHGDAPRLIFIVGEKRAGIQIQCFAQVVGIPRIGKQGLESPGVHPTHLSIKPDFAALLADGFVVAEQFAQSRYGHAEHLPRGVGFLVSPQ